AGGGGPNRAPPRHQPRQASLHRQEFQRTDPAPPCARRVGLMDRTRCFRSGHRGLKVLLLGLSVSSILSHLVSRGRAGAAKRADPHTPAGRLPGGGTYASSSSLGFAWGHSRPAGGGPAHKPVSKMARRGRTFGGSA